MFAVLLSWQTARASHEAIASLSYAAVAPNLYLVQYKYYAVPDSANQAPATQTLNYRAGNCHAGGTLTLTHYSFAPTYGCPSPNNLVENTYTGLLTIPAACQEWVLSVSQTNRLGANIAANTSLYTEATLNNVATATNTSVDFTGRPEIIVLNNQMSVLNLQGIDVDNDSLVYSLQHVLSSAGTPVPFLPGYSLAQPLPSLTPVTLNSATGELTLHPNAPHNTSYTLQVMVEEYRNVNGSVVKVGSVSRDVLLTVWNNQNLPPVLEARDAAGNVLTDFITVSPCTNNLIQFHTSDANPADILIAMTDAATLLPGSAFTITGTSKRPVVNINWQPSATDAGKTFRIMVNVRDDHCPLIGSIQKQYTVFVENKKVVTAQTSDSVIVPGKAVQLTAAVLTSDTTPVNYSYQWLPAAGLSNPNIKNPVANPQVTTRYQVHILNSNTSFCTDTASVLVRVQQATQVPEPLTQQVAVPNVITPNHDGLNDYFVVRDLKPGTSLHIYNRNGQLSASFKEYDNSWAGAGLKSGTYFYILRNSSNEVKSGWVEVLK